MGIQRFDAKVSDLQVLNPNYLTVKLELIDPHSISFTAGQYVIVTIPNADPKRNYSITSNPEINHSIELLIQTVPNGLGSEFFKSVKPGDGVEFRGPAGGFVVAESSGSIGMEEDELIFIANGSGIAPIRSMILHLLQTKKDNRPITLFWGMRHIQDLFWVEDFNQLQQDFPQFKFEVILSQPPDTGWDLSRGYVTDLVVGRIENFERKGYYLCGSSAMIDDATELLQSKGVKHLHIHRERFY